MPDRFSMWHKSDTKDQNKHQIDVCFVPFFCANFANMESEGYSPYIRSLIMASMRELRETTSTKLLQHICDKNQMEVTGPLRTRMIRACKTMVAEIEMKKSLTENKTPIYIIKLKS